MARTTTEEFDATLTPEQRAVIGRAKAFAAQVVAPSAEDWEERAQYPIDAMRAACAEGLAAVEVPSSHGGLGMPFSVRLRVAEEFAKHDFAFGFALINHHNAMARIADSGSPEAVDRYLARMMRGEIIGASALSEPGAGSDFAEIGCRATRDGESWVLDGAKRWICSAAVAEVFITYAQTDPGTRGPGIGCFLVDATRAGFEREAPQRMSGIRAAGVGGFRLQGHRVEPGFALEGPGVAFKAALRSVNKARVYVAAMAAGVIEASLARAVGYGQQRRTFGRPLVEHQGLKWSLAEVATTLEAMRGLVYRGAAMIDRGEDAQLAAAMAKKYCGDHTIGAVARCVQAMGAIGMTSDAGLPRQMAAAKAVCYADGTTEIMNERIGAFLGEYAALR